MKTKNLSCGGAEAMSSPYERRASFDVNSGSLELQYKVCSRNEQDQGAFA